MFFRSRALLTCAAVVFLFFFLFVVAYEEPGAPKEVRADLRTLLR
jgi:hypothetical protein